MIKNLFNISDLSKKDILEIINVKHDNKVLTNKSIGMILKNILRELGYLLQLLFLIWVVIV